MSNRWDEQGLTELLSFIQGKTFPHLGTGITTYPFFGAENQEALHEGCVELERRGLIRRWRDLATESFVIWKPLRG